MPSRGFQSSVSPVLHFGLGSDKEADSLQVIWLGGKQQIITHVKANQFITLDEKNAVTSKKVTKPVTPLFHEAKSPIDFADQPNTMNDFLRQSLLVNPISFFGPCLVKADVNGDGLEDVFAGGGNGQAGRLYVAEKWAIY